MERISRNMSAETARECVANHLLSQQESIRPPRRYRGFLDQAPCTYTPREIVAAEKAADDEYTKKVKVLDQLVVGFERLRVDVWNKKEDRIRELQFMPLDVFDYFFARQDDAPGEYHDDRDDSVMDTASHLVYTIRTANGLCQIGLGRLEIGGLN